MKHLSQDTRNNCGQTCLAMLTGLKVRTVECRMKRTGPTRHKILTAFLRGRGFDVSGFQRWRRPGIPDEPSAVLMVRQKDVRSGHWVVLRSGQIFDPVYPTAVKVARWVKDLEKKSRRVTSYFTVS